MSTIKQEGPSRVPNVYPSSSPRKEEDEALKAQELANNIIQNQYLLKYPPSLAISPSRGPAWPSLVPAPGVPTAAPSAASAAAPAYPPQLYGINPPTTLLSLNTPKSNFPTSKSKEAVETKPNDLNEPVYLNNFLPFNSFMNAGYPVNSNNSVGSGYLYGGYYGSYGYGGLYNTHYLRRYSPYMQSPLSQYYMSKNSSYPSSAGTDLGQRPKAKILNQKYQLKAAAPAVDPQIKKRSTRRRAIFSRTSPNLKKERVAVIALEELEKAKKEEQTRKLLFALDGAVSQIMNKDPDNYFKKNPKSKIDLQLLKTKANKASYQTVDQLKNDFRAMCMATLEATPPHSALHSRTLALLLDGLEIILLNLKFDFLEDSRPCIVCKRSHDPSQTLLCDCCNDPYHMFCLPRPLTEVPLGEWFCESCYVLDQNHSLMTYLSAKKKKKGVQGTSI